MRHDAPGRATPYAILVFTAIMFIVWSFVQEYRRAYNVHVVGWEKNEWWWKQCNQMEFYEKMQEHVDICNKLRVTPRSRLKWLACFEAWQVISTQPLVAGAMALAVFAVVASALPRFDDGERFGTHRDAWRRRHVI